MKEPKDNFPYIEHAALLGQENARKRLRHERVKRGWWVLLALGMSLWDGWRAVERGIAQQWGPVTWYALATTVWLGIIYVEVKWYRKVRDSVREYQKFFSLCPAVVQRIMMYQDEKRREDLLQKMRWKTEEMRDSVSTGL